VIKKKDLSKEDKKVWEDYVKNPSDIYDKDTNALNFVQGKKRFRYDLHGFTLDDANLKVKEIISYCIKKKFKELILITGKGKHSTNEKNIYVSNDLGKLKYSVPEFIKNHEELSKFILSITEAEQKDGGAGALLIKLKSL